MTITENKKISFCGNNSIHITYNHSTNHKNKSATQYTISCNMKMNNLIISNSFEKFLKSTINNLVYNNSYLKVFLKKELLFYLTIKAIYFHYFRIYTT